MKGILGCCYQCDVPPETIQNLRILCMSLKSRPTTQNRLYLHMVYLLTQCATTTRKFFLFFLGGPARSPHNCFFFGWARQDSSQWPQASKLSRKLFVDNLNIFVELFFYLGYSGILTKGVSMNDNMKTTRGLLDGQERVLSAVIQWLDYNNHSDDAIRDLVDQILNQSKATKYLAGKELDAAENFEG